MHTVLEGVVKSFFRYWFELPCSNSYSIKKFKTILNIRLLSIRPPSFVPSCPRPIDDWKHWKGHDFLAFIMFYALPIFHEVMTFPFLINLTKLVLSLEILLDQDIKKDQLELAQIMLEDFVSELENLYDSSIMTSGVHELLHLVQCTIDFGPLNLINGFQFEEMNRKCVGMIHGQDLIGEEFIKIFTTAQSLSVYISTQSYPLSLKDFFSENRCFKTSNQKYLNTLEKLRPLGAKVTLSDKNVIEQWQTYRQSEQLFENYEIYDKISYKGIIYTNYLTNSTKKCDSCIRNRQNKFGLIRCFVVQSQEVYIIAKKLTFIHTPYTYTHKNKKFLSKMSITHETNDFFIEKIDNLEKVALIKIDDNSCYVSIFRSSHLFN